MQLATSSASVTLAYFYWRWASWGACPRSAQQSAGTSTLKPACTQPEVGAPQTISMSVLTPASSDPRVQPKRDGAAFFSMISPWGAVVPDPARAI